MTNLFKESKSNQNNFIIYIKGIGENWIWGVKILLILLFLFLV